eukprot:TRINITY_DN12956_c0_g2_i4.p1 TRINITY_DN12956_c0_g2~~TRINITY_DN12956_c0_g2_i4.p1  ORF type:complete len:198 (-),score=12.43 TRINITY_DN12956_c0_g2_i4:101-694(-)
MNQVNQILNEFRINPSINVSTSPVNVLKDPWPLVITEFSSTFGDGTEIDGPVALRISNGKGGAIGDPRGVPVCAWGFKIVRCSGSYDRVGLLAENDTRVQLLSTFGVCLLSHPGDEYVCTQFEPVVPLRYQTKPKDDIVFLLDHLRLRVTLWVNKVRVGVYKLPSGIRFVPAFVSWNYSTLIQFLPCDVVLQYLGLK